MASFVKLLVLFFFVAAIYYCCASQPQKAANKGKVKLKKPKTVTQDNAPKTAPPLKETKPNLFDNPIVEQKSYNILVVTLCLRGHLNPAGGKLISLNIILALSRFKVSLLSFATLRTQKNKNACLQLLKILIGFQSKDHKPKPPLIGTDLNRTQRYIKIQITRSGNREGYPIAGSMVTQSSDLEPKSGHSLATSCSKI